MTPLVIRAWAQQRTAADFIQLIEDYNIDLELIDIENILDYNEGMALVRVNDLLIEFCDGNLFEISEYNFDCI